MLEYAKELLETYRRATGRPTAALLLGCAGWHATLLARAAYWLELQEWQTLADLTAALNRVLTGADISPSAKIGRRVLMLHPGRVVLEAGAVLEDDVLLDGETFVSAGTRLSANEAESLQKNSAETELEAASERTACSGPIPTAKMTSEDADERKDAALKELVRVVREQNAVIAKLNAALADAGGTALSEEELPKINARNLGLSTRRARHHRSKKKSSAS